jgi:serine/threonine protein phosphatase PrpC
VTAEPECLINDITQEMAYIVIASDGVFEFLSSQAVIDMVQKFDDLQDAANALVAESYRLWLQYETRTDDITITILKVISTYTTVYARAPTRPLIHH